MPRLMLPIAILTLAVSIRPDRAAAHAILMGSQPAAGATLPAGPTMVTLRFNSRVDHARSRVTLWTPKSEATLPVALAGPAEVLAAPATLAPGDYIIRWQVLAIDGHITRGDVPFTVKGD